MNALSEVGRRAKEASRTIAASGDEATVKALGAMAHSLRSASDLILSANATDLKAASSEGGAFLDRLTLNPRRVEAMAESLLAVAEQPWPVGEVVEEWRRPNGLRIQKVRHPLGVVAVIYEARPNVTADVAGLCLRSGNACILRGSSHALGTNKAIVGALGDGLESAGFPADSIQLVEDTSREAAKDLMQLRGLVDLVIPRGGPALIEAVERDATVPYIIDGDGNCHVYVDESADPKMATDIILNAKTSRPGVCNAAETLLVHGTMAGSWLAGALDALSAAGVEIRGDESVRSLWPKAISATEDDWAKEYLDLILAVRVVDSLEEAIEHINRWGTSNAEAIVTEDPRAAEVFVGGVDSGSIFVNASTRFSDGGEFGYGAEIGISTQKLHARGPMGVKDLTSVRYVVWGDGQTRAT